ncbi:MAG: hypothetical protein HYU36_10885 [Planctomycetes bacterium]|nr:hypothetical protein [Planctomycetota bacterium]
MGGHPRPLDEIVQLDQTGVGACKVAGDPFESGIQLLSDAIGRPWGRPCGPSFRGAGRQPTQNTE